VEVEAMDNFWIFLETMAGILDDDDGKAVERLNDELSHCAPEERRQRIKHLVTVADEVSRFTMMAEPASSIRQKSGV
jgi:hypothetical protein